MNGNNIYPTHKQAILVILITMVVTFFASLIAIELGFNKTELLLVEVLTIVPAFVFVIHQKLSVKRIFRLTLVKQNVIITSIFIGFALTILADEVDRITQMLFPMPDVILKAIEEMLQIKNPGEFVIIIFSAVFMAAVCEELLFRGFLQTSLEHTFDVTKAIMLTALIFAIVHFNPWWTIQFILFAIFLGVLAWKSDSIIPSIIVHLINNSVALIFSNFDESYFSWYFAGDHVNPAIVILAIITLVFGFKQFYRYYDEQYSTSA